MKSWTDISIKDRFPVGGCLWGAFSKACSLSSPGKGFAFVDRKRPEPTHQPILDVSPNKFGLFRKPMQTGLN
jgi:hypothetical protein